MAAPEPDPLRCDQPEGPDEPSLDNHQRCSQGQHSASPTWVTSHLSGGVLWGTAGLVITFLTAQQLPPSLRHPWISSSQPDGTLGHTAAMSGLCRSPSLELPCLGGEIQLPEQPRTAQNSPKSSQLVKILMLQFLTQSTPGRMRAPMGAGGGKGVQEKVGLGWNCLCVGGGVGGREGDFGSEPVGWAQLQSLLGSGDTKIKPTPSLEPGREPLLSR